MNILSYNRSRTKIVFFDGRKTHTAPASSKPHFLALQTVGNHYKLVSRAWKAAELVASGNAQHIRLPHSPQTIAQVTSQSDPDKVYFVAFNNIYTRYTEYQTLDCTCKDFRFGGQDITRRHAKHRICKHILAVRMLWQMEARPLRLEQAMEAVQAEPEPKRKRTRKGYGRHGWGSHVHKARQMAAATA